MKRFYITSITILLLLLQVIACSKDEVEAPPMLDIAEQDHSLNFSYAEGSRNINIQTNFETVHIESSEDWLSGEFIDEAQKKIKIKVLEHQSTKVRDAILKIKAGNLIEEIKIIQLGLDPVIVLETKEVKLSFKKQNTILKLGANVELDVICSESWVKLYEGTKSAMVDMAYEFEIDQISETISERSAKVYFKQKDGNLKDSVIFIQSLTSSDNYVAGETNSFEKDKKISIISAVLTPSDKYQGGQNIEKSIDGDNSTIYHSPWGGMPDKTSVTFEYELDPEDAPVINYVVLHPRSSGANGVIKSATVWINTAEDVSFKQVGAFDVTQSNNPVVVRFETPVINPRNVKVVVSDSYSGDSDKYYISLAEFECYESKGINALEADLAFFTDATFSELQPGITIGDIANIKNPFLQNIASFLKAGIYPIEYRVQEMQAYREVNDLAKELKTSSYSQFENITGIYFENEEEIIVFVGDTYGENIALRVRDFGESGDDNTYPLSEGLNVLTMKGKGNGYINYYTPNYLSASKIKIHIASGKVNGFFDRTKNSNEDGQKLLDNAVSDIMDIKGERVQLAYSVNALKQNCYGEMSDLITLYDSIVSSEQTIMGLRKYNRLPKNRMLGRVIWSGYMHADGWGAAFHDNTMGTVANPYQIRRNNWGIAHEFGHVNQVRPGMKWVGTTECTNNLYSAWIQYCFTPNNLRLEHEQLGGVIGARFNAYLNNAFVENQEWGIQAGPDKAYGEGDEGQWEGDHFVKLCPIWQLQLYFHIAGEGNSWYKPYFWADIFEKVRNTDESSFTEGDFQINFVKNTCDALQLDLSDFFIKSGFLQEVDKFFGDYTSAQKTITQAMIDEAVNYVSKYSKPQTEYIQYISGNSIDAYKNKLDVSGQYDGGISGTSSKTIQHATWKNVTVFETYKGDEMTHITLVGTGSSDRSFSTVPYPAGSTRIEAVGYEGTRVLVMGNR
jgi:hypothetical protein